MSNNKDLDPQIVTSLRAVSPPTDEERDAHIAQALSHLTSASSHQRGSLRTSRQWLATAAAVVLLVGGFLAVQNSDENNPPVAAASESTHLIKNSAGQSGRCGNKDATYIGSYEILGTSREVWASTSQITVYASDTCAALVAIDHVDATEDITVCVPSLTKKTDSVVGQYVAKNSFRVLVNTATHLEIFGAPDCTVIARYTHP